LSQQRESATTVGVIPSGAVLQAKRGIPRRSPRQGHDFSRATKFPTTQPRLSA